MLSATGLALTGCSATSSAAVTETVSTIDDLLAETPFYVAHRGSGDNWPEHTMRAYSESVRMGARAIEVSVNATSDGVLVCHHDVTTARVTGTARTIATTSWSELSRLRVDARQWLGPATPLEPLPLLKDVLDRFAATRVIFIEDKQGTNTEALLDLMDTYPDARRHFVWKQPAAARQVTAVTRRGYRTWGYFTQEAKRDIERYAHQFDLLGVQYGVDDATIKQLVGLGKPVICWEIHTRAMRDRVRALGVIGMMCSNLPYVTAEQPSATTDQFATGRRAAGDLPWTVDQGWSPQPVIDAAAGAVTLAGETNTSYRMGSLCPADHAVYTLAFQMRWPTRLPAEDQHAGLAFGQDSDLPYRVLVPGDVGGYHLVFRPNGEIVLLSRKPGDDAGTRLNSMMTAPAEPGAWMSFSVEVSPPGIRFARQDGTGWSGVAMDTAHRGGYLSLCRNYGGPVPVQFRGVSLA